ncbi:hypothetical protein D9M68_868350 [compost metagenome]
MHGARIIEPSISGEVDRQTLSERRQPLDTHRAIVEGWSASDHQIKARESPRVHFIHQLTQCVQALVANISPHTLECFNLIEHQQQTRMP